MSFERLRQLVALDTSGERPTRDAVAHLAAELRAAGASVDEIVSADGLQASLVASVGPPADGDRDGLVLCGHVDVVPAEEPDWSSDPFSLVERDGRWHGRGACDMKGFDALAIEALIERATQPLAAPLVLVLTWGEERGALGARDLVRQRPNLALPRDVIIGEPTSLDVIRMHKGHLKLRIVVEGAAAHSGTPHLGANAIEPGAAIVGALAPMRDELAAARIPESDAFGAVPGAVLTVARIHGGAALNIVPDRCTIEIGVRALPGMDRRAIRERIEHVVRDTVAPFDGIAARVELINDTPPLACAASARVATRLAEVLGPQAPRGVSFASDGGVLAEAYGVECVLWGPGAMAVAHRADEYIGADEYARAAVLLDRVIDCACAPS